MRLFLDQVLYKQPGARPTLAHQDAPFLSFTDYRSINCWIALDDTSRSNGAIEYFMRSQLLGALRLVDLDAADDLTADCSALRTCEVRLAEMKAGDVAFHNCLTVHRAHPNTSTLARRAFSIQYMPVGSRFNGWMHPFLESYKPLIGDSLDLDCCPVLFAEQ